MAKESSQFGQEETPCPPLEVPSLCSNNCGFFGSSTTMNLCSSCYRKLVLLKAKPSPSFSTISPNKSQVQENEEVKTAELSSSFSGGDVSPLALASPPSSDESPEARRCFSCRKRIGLTSFKCRCGDIFCALHRYSDKHNCSFDYKAAGRAAIAKANPVVKADKLERI